MIHSTLAAGRWQQLTIGEQLGNVGSEFGRALSWKRKGDKGKFDAASARCLELLDLTIADERWQGPRRKELTRVREESVSLLNGDEPSRQAGLEKYFLQFAILARSKR